MPIMTSQPTMDAIHAILVLAHHQLLASFRQGNAIGVALLYAEDGQILPVYSAAISGRAALFN